MSKETMNKLNAFQKNRHFHPMTCAVDGDEKHIDYEYAKTESAKNGISLVDYIESEKEKGINFPIAAFTETCLIATENGWVCPVCDYAQSYDAEMTNLILNVNDHY